MHRDPVDSTSLRSIGHDAERRLLEVEFADGDVYRYEEVSLDDYHALLAAPSLGAHLNQVIKPHRPYRAVRRS